MRVIIEKKMACLSEKLHRTLCLFSLVTLVRFGRIIHDKPQAVTLTVFKAIVGIPKCSNAWFLLPRRKRIDKDSLEPHESRSSTMSRETAQRFY
jgi:hypothetical protein